MSKLIASILAREAAYRARKGGKRGRLSLGGGSLVLVKSNLLNIGLFTLLSAGMSIPYMAGGMLPMLMGFLALFMGAFSTAASVNIILSDRLLEPLARLPIRESEVKRALFLLALYWGGLALPFAVIPGAALVAIQLGMPGLVIWGCVEGVAVMLLSYGIGYFAGSLAPKAGRNPTLRMLSMLAWFMLFGAWLLFRFAENLESRPILGLIPPFSFARASLGEPISIISSLAFLAISALTYLYGSGRLWDVIRMASSMTVPAQQKAWKLWRFAAPLLKDLKLLGRNPRMLASTLYFMFLGPPIRSLSDDSRGARDRSLPFCGRNGRVCSRVHIYG